MYKVRAFIKNNSPKPDSPWRRDFELKFTADERRCIYILRAGKRKFPPKYQSPWRRDFELKFTADERRCIYILRAEKRKFPPKYQSPWRRDFELKFMADERRCIYILRARKRKFQPKYQSQAISCGGGGDQPLLFLSLKPVLDLSRSRQLSPSESCLYRSEDRLYAFRAGSAS